MNDYRLVPFLVYCAKHFKLLIAGEFFVAVIWAVDLSLRPYLLKVMIDKLVDMDPSTVIDLLLIPATLYVGMSFLNAMILRFENYLWLYLNPSMKSFVAIKLMDKAPHLPYTFFQNHFAGSLASKFKDVMSGIPDLTQMLVYKLFSHVLALFIALYTIWHTTYTFAFILLPWIIIYLLGSLKLSFKAKYLTDKAADERSSVVGYLADVLGNMVNVWLFNSKDWEQKNKLTTILHKWNSADKKRDWFLLKMYSFQSLSFIIYQVVCLILLIIGLRHQTITPGDFTLVLTLNISLYGCLSDLSNDISNCANIVGNITQGLRVVQSTTDIKDLPSAKKLHIDNGSISFENVCFKYEESKPLFENLSIKMESGQKIGLVGKSGSGKSTFVNLILRLFDINSGRILIDNNDIHSVTLDSLRQNFALIPQDPSLFHRTLLENIHYGNNNVKDEDVISATKRAHLHDFITTLPQGYNSLVGEKGIKLSGGQRQLVAIARAILKNAPILILDEATSHLDSITERYIQESLLDLMQGKTTIVIAHRLSTLLHMDRIIVFSEGKIVEDGNHHSLIKNKGLYNTLWDTQVGGFLGEGFIPQESKTTTKVSL